MRHIKWQLAESTIGNNIVLLGWPTSENYSGSPFTITKKVLSSYENVFQLLCVEWFSISIKLVHLWQIARGIPYFSQYTPRNTDYWFKVFIIKKHRQIGVNKMGHVLKQQYFSNRGNHKWCFYEPYF